MRRRPSPAARSWQQALDALDGVPVPPGELTRRRARAVAVAVAVGAVTYLILARLLLAQDPRHGSAAPPPGPGALVAGAALLLLAVGLSAACRALLVRRRRATPWGRAAPALSPRHERQVLRYARGARPDPPERLPLACA